MIIQLVDEVNEKDFINLYKDAGWWLDEYDKDISFIQPLVKGSFLFAVAFDDNMRIIAMARAISDGVSDAYIQDVVVLKSYRNNGIGVKIINFILQKLQEHGVDWVALIAEPGTESFYNNLNFQKMPDFIPMKLMPIRTTSS
jgi:spermidine synthase